MRRSLFIVFALSVSLLSEAQYMVEIKPDKKVVHVNELGLSPNTGIMDVLQAMPELLDRSSNDLFANFNIQVDGKDVGKSRDVVLVQTKVAEVDVIEVSTSPTVSEQKNGEGGVINIKMKPITQEGVSGDVLVDVDTEWDVQPSVLLNYKKGKFTLRSSLMMEYWHPTEYKESQIKEKSFQEAQYDTTSTQYGQETAKLHMQWNPTTQDELTVYAWETFAMAWTNTQSMEQMWINQEPTGNPVWKESRDGITQKKHERQLKAEGQVSYKHLYTRGGELKIEATYNYVPGVATTRYNRYDADLIIQRVGVADSRETNLWSQSHQVLGEISSKQTLLKPNSPHVLDMKIGISADYDFGNKKEINSTQRQIDTLHTNAQNLHVSPFMEWDYNYHGWYIKMGARYQYFRYGEKFGNTDGVLSDHHTWFANLSVMWQVKQHHILRLVTARNSLWNMTHLDDEGNVAPTVEPYYNAELNYTFDWNNTIDFVELGLGVKYVYAKQTTRDVGLLVANTQLIYKHGIFSLVYAGNAYMKREYFYEGTVKDNWRMFYNVSLTPVFSFRKQWTLSAKLLYNSEIIMSDAIYGDCFYTQLRLAKDIRNWNIHLQLNDILDYDTYDTIIIGDWTQRTLLDLYPRSIQIGFAYKF
ncbi:MAG: outer membrane beta-barrel family protein [Paludibacteraceae bacterium]|nr:outer membrane beta-barrel family protein [Paludibacteraceae bacterium]